MGGIDCESGITGGFAPAPEPGVVPWLTSAGVVLGMVALGFGICVGAALGSVPGVAEVPPLGVGGPASGCPDAGGIFVLDGSATWPLLPNPDWLLPAGFAGVGLGVSSFDVGALLPNGLR